MSEKLIFGYWGVRGLGQVSRLLLNYTGAVWEDVKYTSPEQWFEKDKQNLGIPFANLPYLIDGDFKLSESKSINKYIIAKSEKKELLGKNLQDQARVESLLSVFTDISQAIVPLFYEKDWEPKLPAVLEKISSKFDQFNSFYGEKEFALGYLTLIDFQVAEFSYFIEKISPETFSKYAFLARTRNAYHNVPEIKNYYDQETALKAPFISPQAVVKF